MIRSGDICKGCGSVCVKDYSDGRLELECPKCCGLGCQHCNDGFFTIRECPKMFIGNEMASAMNLAWQCGGGDWPVPGGLLKQSAWFMDLKTSLDNARNQIENEGLERMKKKYGS